MPTFFGHAKEQERMIQDLQSIYQEAHSATNWLSNMLARQMPAADFRAEGHSVG